MKIVIIEDDPQIQQIYKERLEQEGFEISAAVTGQDGLDLVKKEQPVLVILDIMLPGTGMNGFDVLEQMKKDETVKDIPVIVLTNLDTEEKTAKDIGAVDYIVKANASMDEVVEKVKMYMKGE